MNLGEALTKKRELAVRFAIVGLAIASLGVGTWLWSTAFGGDDQIQRDAVISIVGGLIVAGVAMTFIVYRKRGRGDS